LAPAAHFPNAGIDHTSHDQLSRVLDVLGTPTIEEFYAITSRRSKEYVREMPFRKKRSFESLYPNANPLAIDFLTKTLTCELPCPIRATSTLLSRHGSFPHSACPSRAG
jgi:hypothetical protein